MLHKLAPKIKDLSKMSVIWDRIYMWAPNAWHIWFSEDPSVTCYNGGAMLQLFMGPNETLKWRWARDLTIWVNGRNI